MKNWGSVCEEDIMEHEVTEGILAREQTHDLGVHGPNHTCLHANTQSCTKPLEDRVIHVRL